MKKILPALALCILAVSCNQNPPPSAYAKGQASQTMDQSQPADWQITAKVKETLLADTSLSPSNRLVSVNTTDGVVTLTGTVSSQDQMNEIVNKTVSVSGVKSVNNQMTLSQP